MLQKEQWDEEKHNLEWLSDPSGSQETYIEISNNDFNTFVKEILDILPDGRETYVIGVLRQRSIHVQRHQIRVAIE